MCSRAENIARALNELADANLVGSAPVGSWNQLIEDYYVDDTGIESDSDGSDDDKNSEDIVNAVLLTEKDENNLDLLSDDEGDVGLHDHAQAHTGANNHNNAAQHVEQNIDDSESDGEEEAGLGQQGVHEVDEIMQQVDILDPDVETEMDKIRNFKCECVSRRKENSKKGYESCSAKLTPEFIYRCRLDMAALSSDERDLVIIGKISSLGNFGEFTERSKQKNQKKRAHQKTSYLVEGKSICRSAFRFVHMVSQWVLDSCFAHYRENGISSRPEKRGGRREKNRNILSHDDIRRVVSFICNYAEEHAIVLPGRHPGQKRLDLKLLPSYVTKSSVHRLYSEEVKKIGHRAVKISSFRSLWRSLTPHITRTKPMSDLCWLCQKNNYAVYRSSNLPEEVKSAKLKKQEQHLLVVTKERSYLNEMVARAKEACEAHSLTEVQKSPPSSRPMTMHYSFDYAQQVHFPADPLQPGPIYFLTPRKCGLFGICCEAIPQQVNYLIDEGMNMSKGSLSVINYLDHYLANYGLGETDLQLHCDNCSGQNKNRFMLHYLAWRTIHGLHKTISLNFLITGHTKFAPDWCFGLIKQRYRRTKVNTLDEIADVVHESSPVKRVNKAQVVGKEDGTVIVECSDWKGFLDQYFKPLQGIRSYQHFSFSAENPGVVVATEYCDSEESKTLQLLRQPNNLPPRQCPTKINPPGLDAVRQSYLYDNIREFCDDDAKDICCPNPTKKRK